MGRWQMALVVSIALGAQGRALAQAPIPELRFADPAGFYRSAMYPPADFSSTEVNASLQVYPFRQVNGDVRQAFSRTLMREFVDARYRETNIAPGGRIDAITIPGADLVLRARFNESISGQMSERMRLAVVVGSSVAIVDASAISAYSWERVIPRLNAFAATLQVVSAAPVAAPSVVASSPSSAPSEHRGVAGVYMGISNKYDAIRRQLIPAAFYYLFSPGGLVHRAYDELPLPGNDPSRFDYGAARRNDMVNTGMYRVSGDSIIMHLGVGFSDKVIGRIAPGNTIVIGQVRYERQ